MAYAPDGAPAEDRRSTRIIPSWTDPVARRASAVVGGPWGRHGVVGRTWFWTPLRIMLGLAILTLALAWVKEQPCAAGQWLPGHKQFTHLCYSDAVPLYGGHGLDRGAVPYFDLDPNAVPNTPGYGDGRVEYPVLSGAFMYTAAELARVYDGLSAMAPSILPELSGVEGYFVVTCLLLSLCALVVVWATARSSGTRVWDGALVALSPLLIVHAFTNWDLFAMALASAAILAWARKHPILAGVLIGLGAAAKLYPIFFLGPLLALAIRTGRYRAWVAATVSAVVAWAVVNVPVAVLAPEGWKLFFELNDTRPADYDSLWQLGERLVAGVPQFSFQALIPAEVLNTLVIGLFGAACLAIASLTVLAPYRPRMAQVLFLVVAAFLLINKVWSPQYSLWLLPLAVLARPRWPLLLVWQAVEALLWMTRMLWLLNRDQTYAGEPLRGVDYEWFALSIIVRDALVITLMVLVVREILRPELDVVRRCGMDDPAGGVFDGAPDRLPWLRRPAARWEEQQQDFRMPERPDADRPPPPDRLAADPAGPPGDRPDLVWESEPNQGSVATAVAAPPVTEPPVTEQPTQPHAVVEEPTGSASTVPVPVVPEAVVPESEVSEAELSGPEVSEPEATDTVVPESEVSEPVEAATETASPEPEPEAAPAEPESEPEPAAVAVEPDLAEPSPAEPEPAQAEATESESAPDEPPVEPAEPAEPEPTGHRLPNEFGDSAYEGSAFRAMWVNRPRPD